MVERVRALILTSISTPYALMRLHSGVKGEPLARETASETDVTILAWPHERIFFSSWVFDSETASEHLSSVLLSE